MKKIILSTIIMIMLMSSSFAKTAAEEYEEMTGKKVPVSEKTTTIVAAVPSGAVMAFDLGGKCPSGWSKWAKANGRVIVGTGKRDGETYKNNQIGGKAKAVISANNIGTGRTEIQTMSIKVRENQSPPYVAVSDTSVVSKECVNREKHCTRFPTRPYTVDMGRDDADPFDNRQPFVALTYCKKR